VNEAKKFVKKVQNLIEEIGPRSVAVEDGIVKITFLDGSYVDFTQPLARTKIPK
jgi:hypothetical protein